MKEKVYVIAMMIMVAVAAINADARSIEGVVVDDMDRNPLAGAGCSLLLGDSVVSSMTSGRNGEFVLSVRDIAPVKLQIECPGYAPATVFVDNIEDKVKLGEIGLQLALSTVLDEVTVEADAVSHSNGRTIVIPSARITESAQSSLAMLQMLPLSGLFVDQINRTVSVDGGVPLILINGVPSSMTELNTLQPKDILKVEFSRITPARYIDKGNNGILMITLKERNNGGQVSLWGRSATTCAFVDAQLTGSYYHGPSQFTISYIPSWRNVRKCRDVSEGSYIGDDFRVDYNSADVNPFSYLTNDINFRYNYSPSSSTLLSATFNIAPYRSKTSLYGVTHDSMLGDYEENTISRSNSYNPSLDLFFHKDFNARNVMEVQVVGTLMSDSYTKNFNYTFDDQTTETFAADVDSRRQSLISELSYQHKFRETSILSAGFQNTVSRSRNKYISSDERPVLTENNNYAYVSYSLQVNRVYFSLSTGAKLFWIKNDLNRRRFIKNISTASFDWNISRMWGLQFQAKYTPQIPGLTALTDHPQQTSPYLISNGNPELRTAQRLYLQLLPRFSYKHLTLMLMGIYSRCPDAISTEVSYIGDRMFMSRQENVKSVDCYVAAGYARFDDFYGFGAEAQFNYERFESDMPDGKIRLNSFSGNVSAWWSNDKFTVKYSRKFPGKQLWGSRVSKEENYDVFSFNYTPLKNLHLGVEWWYMFCKGTSYPYTSYSKVNPSTTSRIIKDNANMVVLTLSYNINFGKGYKSTVRGLNNSDNSSSILKY